MLKRTTDRWPFLAVVLVFVFFLKNGALPLLGEEGEKVRVKLDYIFSGNSSDVEVGAAEEVVEESNSPEVVSPSSAKVESKVQHEVEHAESEAEGESSGGDQVTSFSDFVGDRNGESGIVSDEPTWQGTHSETLVNSQVDSSSGARRAAGTTFDDGYIPEFDEELKLEDSDPGAVEEAYSHHDGRFPRNWVVPPGARSGYPLQNADFDYPAYSRNANYEYVGPDGQVRDFGTYRGSRSTYPESRYDSWRLHDYHHPEGPYGYGFNVDDPFWDLPPNYYGDAGYDFDAGWNIFSRFDPETAHLKAGPFFLQLVSLEFGVLYSDYDGPLVFRPGEEDGWLGFTSLRMRVAARITPKLFFMIDGELIYVFGGSGFGIRSTAGTGSPFLSLEYVTQRGMWDIRIYDNLGTAFPFVLDSGDDSFKRAGRYSFGFQGVGRRRRDNHLFDPIIYNKVGIQATRLVNPNWRLSLEADHTDFFYLDSDRGDTHRSRQHLGVEYGAVPGALRFNPYARYDTYTVSNSDRWQHVFFVGGSGQVSDSVRLNARTGYFWQTGDDKSNGHWLWDLGLRHRISERTSHGVNVGQGFFENEFTDDSVVASYLKYYVSHEATERARVFAFAQWADNEVITGRVVGGENRTEIYGVRLTYRASRRVQASLGYRFQETENTVTGFERDRSIFDARLDGRLGPRTSGYLLYQFEEDDIFDEDLYMAGVRRYF